MIRAFQQRAEQTVSGFKSPADDYLEGRLNIADVLVIDPHCTYYFRMDSPAMTSYGLLQGDILVIDKSLKPVHGAIVIAFADGCFCCRCYQDNGSPRLVGDNDTIDTTGDDILQIWGVVTSICRTTLPEQLRKGKYKHVCTL